MFATYFAFRKFNLERMFDVLPHFRRRDREFQVDPTKTKFQVDPTKT
jgi:hypothetical protein